MSTNPLDVGCLRLFEQTARHQNLTRAAEALGVTQPALSYRIRQIEELLGVTLFHRRHRGLALTREGEVLQRAVSQGLESLDDAVNSIRQRAATPTVRLITDFAFATFRLMPLVARFRREHPAIDVQIVATQSLLPRIENEHDLPILFGARSDMPGEAQLLIPERVTTVCSSAFRGRRGPFASPEQLLDVPLIHLEGDEGGRWFTWESWFAAAGIAEHASAASLSFNTYTLAIQAAQSGQGVALGWHGLIDDQLASGTIVQACDLALDSDRGYWLLQKPASPPEVELVAETLVRGLKRTR
ncbi:LysR substrate-binding domain-containing protein [Chelativorans sp. YIM 93263]|uniref:LysR substrate-binding domain-containing protein n=1 Tax=Chelativorans sp. YIM 93263 TaxID=2906648 RepID=UPI002379A021|nr:LysR substrate-binding domain-containing protein [Chelativorans sp. YIM 93263]